ncbi:MAG: YraN family protein [Kiritimatiellae bacterium]|nr:YraN family protein [Kiritimatiellia bacterium]
MIIKKLLTWLFFHKHESKASNLENPAENTILAKDALGIHGEKLAAEFLKSKGFKIIGERVHIGMDELDLIAIDYRNPMVEQIVFVEVKTRSSALFGGGKAAVDTRKRKALIRAAKGYLKKTFSKPHAVRFDIIEVIKNQDSTDPNAFDITHHENAIALPKGLITTALYKKSRH